MILADTGAVYALIDASDAWHGRVREWWKQTTDAILVPVTVLPEVCYLLHTRIAPAAELAFVDSLAHGEFAVEPLEPDDVSRAAAVMSEYADLGLGFVDATIVAMAERLRVKGIATTDRRHFGVVRPRHSRMLTLLP